MNLYLRNKRIYAHKQSVLQVTYGYFDSAVKIINSPTEILVLIIKYLHTVSKNNSKKLS